MDLNIEKYFRANEVEGDLGSSRRDKGIVHTKQIIIYILSQSINSRSIAKMMDCSQATVYKSIKAVERLKEDQITGQSTSFLITRTKAALTHKYGFPFLETGEIPILLRK